MHHQSRISLLSPMKAWRVHSFGPPNVMTLDDMQKPEPGAGEVLVRVKAAGVGPWDAWIRAGKSALPQPLPLTLGSDLSGTVEAVGSSVSPFRIGDEVFGVTNARFTGSYADYAVASIDMLARKPARLDHIDAASVPVIAVTAWQALFELAKLTRGSTVLIHGAGGNVGAYAVQLAARAGVHVIATAGADDIPAVRSLGAGTVIDFRSATRFEDVARRVDAVIDVVGGDVQTRSFSVLRAGGVLVSTASPPDQDLARQFSVTAAFFLVNVSTDRLSRIAEMIGQGALTTNVGTVLPLASARVAHEMLDGVRPHPSGKIVLRIGR